MQPGKYWFSLMTQLFGRNRDDQVLPSFSPTTFQNDPPVSGLHPFAETMGALSFDSARLISTFHGKYDPLCRFLTV